LSVGNIKKVCKNQKCTNYNAEYGIDENYCGVCGSELALKGQQEEKPPDLKKKKGFLVMPDKSRIEITKAPRAIGRIHLSKFVPESDINYISRENITLYEEEEEGRYFVEDGKTTVQEKPSRNKTWIISGGQQKEEITEKGRRELKDGDVISIANVVDLSFALTDEEQEDDKGIVS
jgi:hypothetical protein